MIQQGDDFRTNNQAKPGYKRKNLNVNLLLSVPQIILYLL